MRRPLSSYTNLLAVDEEALVVVHQRRLVAVRLLIVANVGVVRVLLPAGPPRLGGVELSEEGACLLPVLLGPERAALDAPLQRRRSAGVAVVVQVEAVQVRIRVSDTGVGSPPRGTTETGHLARLTGKFRILLSSSFDE